MTISPPKIRCRQIEDADIGGLVELLTLGFGLRSRAYWGRAFNRLADHATPPGMPKYGYLLESGGRPEGVILTIFSSIPGPGGPRIQCNLSSWYVTAPLRSYASLLISNAIRHKDVTYLNISSAPLTRPIIEAQGFSRYSSGQFVAAPALAPRGEPATVVKAGEAPLARFDAAEYELLLAHARFGCIAVWCDVPERAYPFVFLPRLVKGVVPCAQLIYGNGTDQFVRFARPLGRFLAARGRPLVIVDSNGPIAGLVGKYYANKYPRYFKGAQRPNWGDLPYTEAVMFGL
jgi:hypothetical protein